MERSNARDFYTDEVLPALQQTLDTAFPEFGWRRDRHGWVATNQEFTHRALGVRADRVVAHGPAPRGFLVHGADAVLWTAYLNGGVTSRGRDFVIAVRELAGRAGVDEAPLDRPQPRDRRAELLQDVFLVARRELAGEGGTAARAYLEQRGFPREKIADSLIGVMPECRQLADALARAGYARSEIQSSGVLADSRWHGRIVGWWRDESGNARTLWSRATHDSNHADAKYLYLRGASRSGLPPYGLTAVLAGPVDRRREIVLLEGVMDVHLLRVHGVDNVCALGGTGAGPELFERLAWLGIEVVTLCFDNDSQGRLGAMRAVEAASRALDSPAVMVIDPAALRPAKDADEVVRDGGADAWAKLVRERVCGVGWRTLELAGGVERTAPVRERRAALARAGAWLATLPPRLSLEQEDALRAAAKRCGYSVPAVERAFRARFWRPALPRGHSEERHVRSAYTRER